MATIADSGDVKLAAGSKISDSLTSANYTTLINWAESELIADTKINVIDAYSGLDADFQPVMTAAVANKAAFAANRYDQTGWPTLNHAITAANMNLDEYDRAVKEIQKSDVFKPFGLSKMTS